MVFLLLPASLALGAIGAWSSARWGPTLGILDRANQRSSHQGSVPKGGGIGILAAFLMLAGMLRLPVVMTACAALVSLLSLYGDRRELAPKVRLLIQLLAAGGFVVGLIFWNDGAGGGGPGVLGPAWLVVPVWAVFIAGTANYYNFMDGINGIAGITGIVGFGLLGLFALFALCGLQGAPVAVMVLAGGLVCACGGFLPFNIPRARVFMGDVGSVLLGFLFAGLIVALARDLTELIALTACLFPFYADELTTAYVRLKDGENLLQAHRRHVYQLLANEKGIAHWKVSAGYGVLQLVVGAGAMQILTTLREGSGCGTAAGAASAGVARALYAMGDLGITIAVSAWVAGWFAAFAYYAYLLRREVERGDVQQS